MTEKNSNFEITRPEIRFWLVIIGVAVSGVIAFTQLQGQVKAIDNSLEEFKTSEKLLIDVRERVIRIEKDIEFIKVQTE